MDKYIIVGAILLVGAVVLGVSWFWTKKLLDKRAEGLDRRALELEIKERRQDSREEELDEREEKLARTEASLAKVTYEVRVTEDDIVSAETGELLDEAYKRITWQSKKRAIYGCLEAARDFVSLKIEKRERFGSEDEIVLRAVLWVCRKETEEAG